MKENSKSSLIMIMFFCAVIVFSISMGVTFRVTSFVRPDTSPGTVIYEPEFEKTDSGYVYRFKLPDRDLSGEYLAVQTTHFSDEMYIDDEKVYVLLPGDAGRSTSTGIAWNYIKLRSDDSGRECTLKIYSEYSSLKPKAQIFLGEKYDIIRSEFAVNGVHFVLALLILAVGTILLVYTLAIADTAGDYAPLFFSCYSILLASWSIMGSPVTAMLTDHSALLTTIEHFSLMLMPMAFLLFLKQTYRNSEHFLWNITLYAGIFTIVVRLFCQLFEIADLRETLWITQTYVAFFVVSALVLSINEIMKNKLTAQLAINYACLALVLSATVAELIIFRVFGKPSSLGMICFLIYVIIMAINLVRISQKTKKRAREAEIYKNLAYTDVLTGVFSRTAFMNDISTALIYAEESRCKNIAVFMFDLNNLKKCNDEFGHENGDKYIKSVSAVISDVIGVDGKCYRIGGDEFSAIMQYNSQHEIDNKLSMIQRRVADLNKEKFVVTMSVAAGYAVYDSENDDDLNDTMKRADEMMYENKQKMKQKIAQ